MNRILLVGTVRNVSGTLRAEVMEKKRLFENFGKVNVYLVESDSSDQTRDVLVQLTQADPTIQFCTLGDIGDRIPDRIERLRNCRNAYVDYIRRFPKNTWKFVVVLDWDGMNSRLSFDGIQNTFLRRSEWDACFPVQSHGYYDLLALREKIWMPQNPLQLIRQEISSLGLDAKDVSPVKKLFNEYKKDRIRKRQLYEKMKVFHRQDELIEVESAFGGMGVYRSEIFQEINYDKFENDEECEHVDFNKRALSFGYRIRINPGMINSGWNSYNVNRYFVVRLYRRFGLRLNLFLYLRRMKNRQSQ